MPQAKQIVICDVDDRVTISVQTAVKHRDFSCVEVTGWVNGSAIVDMNHQPVVGLGYSRRNPLDKANPKLGFDLAVGRAVENLGTKMLRRCNGEVTRIDNEQANKLDEATRAEKKAKWEAKVAASKLATTKLPQIKVTLNDSNGKSSSKKVRKTTTKKTHAKASR